MSTVLAGSPGGVSSQLLNLQRSKAGKLVGGTQYRFRVRSNPRSQRSQLTGSTVLGEVSSDYGNQGFGELHLL